MAKKKIKKEKPKTKTKEEHEHSHDEEHECAVCSGKINIDLWQEEMEKKHGWFAHYVFDDPSCPYKVNIHTHGLEKYGHRDLQVCFPIPKEIIHNILIDIVEEIKKGKKYVAGIKYSGIIKNYDLEFSQSEENGRPVMRIIFPDKHGNIQTYDGKPNPQLVGCKFQPNKN